MQKLIVTLALSGAFATSYAQDVMPIINAPDKMVQEQSGIKPTPIEVEFIGFRNTPSEDMTWQATITRVSKNESENDELLERIKKEKAKLRANYVDPENYGAAGKTTAVAAPVVSTNFSGINNSGAQTPLDNTMAISDSGYIVAAVNSRIGYFNSTTGVSTYSNTLYSFIGDATLTNNMCDPLVMYDNYAKRFIFYAQICDAVSANSRVIIGFSKAQNPAAGWYFHKLTGNPLGDGSWWDYPKMGVSKDDLFVTGNLFYASDNSFNQSMIYQIRKAPGLVGSPITAVQYPMPSAFTILPLSKGQAGSYGPGIFLVSTQGSTSGSNQLKVHQITNNVASGTALLNTYSATCPTYSSPGNAVQKGTSTQLNTGDARAMSGFYLNGYIHFAHNKDAGGGYCGINYHRIKIPELTVASYTFKDSGNTDLAYPAICAATNDSNNKSVLISFNQVSSSKFPRTCVVNVDNAMAWSPVTVVKAGVSFVNYPWTTGGSERWGDYNGIAKKYNGTEAWVAGMYGNATNTWSQWIAKIKPYTVGVDQPVVEEVESAQVFPNPIIDNYHVQFSLSERQMVEITITDVQGRTVANLYNNMVEKGKNRFSFNKANLSPGVYFLNIKGATDKVKHERIVVSQN